MYRPDVPHVNRFSRGWIHSLGSLSMISMILRNLLRARAKLKIALAGACMLFTLSQFSSGAAPSNPALPASAAFSQWLAQERNSGSIAFTRPQTLANGLDLAIAREKEMRALMEKNPA